MQSKFVYKSLNIAGFSLFMQELQSWIFPRDKIGILELMHCFGIRVSEVLDYQAGMGRREMYYPREGEGFFGQIFAPLEKPLEPKYFAIKNHSLDTDELKVIEHLKKFLATNCIDWVGL